MIGPGNYDGIVKILREKLGADGVLLIVKGGQFGNGSSMRATLETQQELPGVLRRIADEMEKDMKKTEEALEKGELPPGVSVEAVYKPEAPNPDN